MIAEVVMIATTMEFMTPYVSFMVVMNQIQVWLDLKIILTPLMLIIGNGTSEDENNTDAMLDIPEDQSSEEDDFVEITEN